MVEKSIQISDKTIEQFLLEKIDSKNCFLSYYRDNLSILVTFVGITAGYALHEHIKKDLSLLNKWEAEDEVQHLRERCYAIILKLLNENKIKLDNMSSIDELKMQITLGTFHGSISLIRN